MVVRSWLWGLGLGLVVGCGGAVPGASVCAGRTFVAVVPDGDCSLGGALPDGWSSEAMFGPVTPALREWTAPRSPRLARYCVVEAPPSFDPRAPVPDAVAEVVRSTPGADVARDCTDRVVPAGAVAPGASPEAAFTAALHAAIQRVDAEALPERPAGAVQLTVLDTAGADTRAAAPADADLEHGLLMRDLARDVACPGGATGCSVAFGTSVAMPRRAGRVDWARGGTAGTAVDVARAVVGEVGRWQAVPGVSRRLVLNLSLGWETTDPGSPAERAVEDALAFASCADVLVVAASGNLRTDADATGPLTPARHQQTPSPTAAQCAAWGFDDPADPGPRPLVLAVGGVDAHDADLYNTRPGARPPLVAFGEASLPAPGLATQRTPLTGTSAASAVTAGLAARVWSLDPDATPAAVGALPADGAVPVGRPAEVRFGDAPREARRVSVCGTLAAMGVVAPGSCAGEPRAAALLDRARRLRRDAVRARTPTRRF